MLLGVNKQCSRLPECCSRGPLSQVMFHQALSESRKKTETGMNSISEGNPLEMNSATLSEAEWRHGKREKNQGWNMNSCHHASRSLSGSPSKKDIEVCLVRRQHSTLIITKTKTLCHSASIIMRRNNYVFFGAGEKLWGRCSKDKNRTNNYCYIDSYYFG